MPEPLTLADLRQLLVIFGGVPEAQALSDPETPLVEAGVDSVVALAIRVELEQRFGLEPAEDDLHELSTLGELLAHVNRRLGAGEGGD